MSSAPDNAKKRKAVENSNIPASVFGTKPVPDIVLHVHRFLHHTITTNQDKINKFKNNGQVQAVDIEIEGKLGTLIDKYTNKRVNFPVYDETILTDNHNFVFNSKMSMENHHNFNQLLNRLVNEKRATYAHTKEVDEFIQNQQFGKLRKTRDSNGQVKVVIAKERLADLNIYMPSHPFDVRISINIEAKVHLKSDASSNSEYKRIKDRLSYSSYPFQIDLTQVKERETVAFFD